jgi:peptide subunit release factor RF-3
MSTLTDEMARRRTVAVVSHVDAGNTALTGKSAAAVPVIKAAAADRLDNPVMAAESGTRQIARGGRDGSVARRSHPEAYREAS